MIDAAIGSGKTELAKTMLREMRRELDMAEASAPDDPARREDELTYRMLANKAGIDVPMDPELLAGGPGQPQPVTLAPFHAKDLNGKAWSDADLRGKVTYVATWRASGCGSCSANLQGVRALYERWKDRSDRAVLTISTDENAAIPETFMKENGYSFPVIHGADIARKIVGSGGWPRQWLIDPEGRRVHLRVPASDDPISQIEEKAEKIAAIR